MKNKIKQICIFCIAVIVMFTSLPVHTAEAKGNVSIKGLKSLKAGKKYYYDLDGNGKKECIYWVVQKEKNSEDQTIFVYLNQKCIFKQFGNWEYAWGISLCNINNKDKYVEILIESTCSDAILEGCKFLRYKNGRLSTMFSCEGEEQREKQYYSVSTIGAWIIKGNGTVIHKNDADFYNDSIGQRIVHVPLKEVKGKLVYTKPKYYKLSLFKAYEKTMGKYNHRAGERIPLYKKADANSGTAFYMESGQYFLVDYMKIVSWEKVYWDVNSWYVRPNLFVRVKTEQGKSGWMYLPAGQKMDFTDNGALQLPGWR